MASYQLSLLAIRHQHEKLSRLLVDNLGPKIRACEGLLDANSRLMGIYAHSGIVATQLGLKNEHNPVLANALSNNIYVSLTALDLIKGGYYGSARMLLRQAFEMLLTAKLSTLDTEVIDRWLNRPQLSGRRGQVGISREILNRFWNGSDPSPLHELWQELNDFTHHTRFAQQPILFPAEEEEDHSSRQNFLVASGEVLAQSEFTLDLVFALEQMAHHMLRPHLRNNVRYFLSAYAGEETRSIERLITSRAREWIRRYWRPPLSSRPMTKLWGPRIRFFKSDWNLQRVVESGNTFSYRR